MAAVRLKRGLTGALSGDAVAAAPLGAVFLLATTNIALPEVSTSP